jgi:hypothetical protein
MYTIKEVKSKVEQRQKMVSYLHAVVPELRKLATTLKLNRNSDSTLNKRDKDKLNDILAKYRTQYAVNAYLKTDSYSIMLHARYSSIQQDIIVSATEDRSYYDQLKDYHSYTADQLISALKRKEEIKNKIRELQNENSRLETSFDLNNADFFHGGE